MDICRMVPRQLCTTGRGNHEPKFRTRRNYWYISFLIWRHPVFIYFLFLVILLHINVKRNYWKNIARMLQKRCSIQSFMVCNFCLQCGYLNMVILFWYLVTRDLSRVRYCTVSYTLASLFTRYQNNTAMYNWSPCTIIWPSIHISKPNWIHFSIQWIRSVWHWPRKSWIK